MYTKSIKEQAQEVLDLLRERGWWRSGEADPSQNQLCLWQALSRAGGIRLNRAVRERIGMSIIRWNDAEGRTFGDVEELLQELGAR